MNYKPLLILIISLVALSESFAQKQKLFNGKDLEGWINYGNEKWYVEDGLIVAESGPKGEYGYLGTEGTFKDFVLTLEFKQEKDGNSGLFFHSSIEGTKIAGWQAEIAPPGHDSGGIYESYGRGWLIKPDPAVSDKALKYGEWNKMKLEVKGDQVTTWLNGEQMITLNDEKIGDSDGQIALQIHSGGGLKLYFKKIVIKPLK